MVPRGNEQRPSIRKVGFFDLDPGIIIVFIYLLPRDTILCDKEGSRLCLKIWKGGFRKKWFHTANYNQLSNNTPHRKPQLVAHVMVRHNILWWHFRFSPKINFSKPTYVGASCTFCILTPFPSILLFAGSRTWKRCSAWDVQLSLFFYVCLTFHCASIALYEGIMSTTAPSTETAPSNPRLFVPGGNVVKLRSGVLVAR